MAKGKPKSAQANNKVVSLGTKKSGKSESKNSPSSVRPLLAGQIPKSVMRVSGDHNGFRISGVEVIDKTICSTKFRREAFLLNPVSNELFPKLSGMALQFQRYRFRRVRLHYYSASPATRSGALALGISTQFMSQDDVPSDFISVSAFEFASCGSVSQSFSTPPWLPGGSERFNMPESGSLRTLDDVYKTIQGSLFTLAGDADTSDDQKNAGYVGIEYDVEMFGFRPTINKMISVLPTKPQTFALGGQTLLALTGPDGETDHTSVTDKVGGWIISGFKSIVPTDLLNSATSVLSSIKSGSDYVVKYLVPLAAAVAASRDAWDDSDFKAPVQSRRVSVASSGVQCYYNPSFVDKENDWLPMDEKECAPRENCSRQLPARFVPLVAGDVVVNLLAYDDQGVAHLLLTQTVSLGTTAQNIGNSFAFTMPAGYNHLTLSVNPTAGESRDLVIPGTGSAVRPVFAVMAASGSRTQ